MYSRSIIRMAITFELQIAGPLKDHGSQMFELSLRQQPFQETFSFSLFLLVFGCFLCDFSDQETRTYFRFATLSLPV